MDDRPGTPANWRLEVPSDRIDLYLELAAAPRPLSAVEATMLVELVDLAVMERPASTAGGRR